MKKHSKKILALLITCCLCVCMIPFSFAAETQAEDGQPAFVIDTVSGKQGDEVKVNISMRNNPGVAIVQFNVSYDSDALTLVSYERGPAMKDASFTWSQHITDNPYHCLWSGPVNRYDNGVMITFTFKIKDDAKPGSSTITLSYDPDNVINQDFENVNFAVQAGGVTVACSHTAGVWEVQTPATCTEPGTEVQKCTKCGEVVNSRVIEATGHTAGAWEVHTAPTCTQPGTEIQKCIVCGAVANTREIAATGHSFGEWETVTSPTCTDKGSEQRVCSVCGYTETRDVEATGHVWENEYTVDKEATCTEDGSRSIHCTVCDAVKDSQVIPATGHDYTSEVVQEPTCTESGLERLTCTVCGHEEERVIPATGHDWGEWIVDKEATEAEEGNRHHECAVCGAVETEVIPVVEPEPTEPAETTEPDTLPAEQPTTPEATGDQTGTDVPETGDSLWIAPALALGAAGAAAIALQAKRRRK